MKWVSLLSLALAFTTTPVFAQAVAQLPLQHNVAQCPVGLEVTHGAGLPVSMAARGSGNPAVPPAQGIHLMLTNLGVQGIAGMKITVHGLSGKSRTVPTADLFSSSDVSRTLQLKLDVKPNGRAVRDLSLSHFTAVTSVDLDSIDYADGSRWTGSCRVFPDPLMLVAAR